MRFMFFPRSRPVTPRRSSTLSIILCLLLGTPSYAAELASGPMPGYVGMRDATIWLQTQSSASVQLRYWAQEEPAQHYLTEMMAVNASTDFTAHIQILNLEPETVYGYQVYVDGIEVSFETDLHFHTLPFRRHGKETPEFTVTVGSCSFIDDSRSDRSENAYGGGFEIFDTIASHKPAFMLWLGDHIYLRETDIHSATGIAYRYRHVPKLRPITTIASRDSSCRYLGRP